MVHIELACATLRIYIWLPTPGRTARRRALPQDGAVRGRWGSRPTLWHAERVLPCHHLGTCGHAGALLDACLDELVLVEEGQHVVHGVVGARLLAKVELPKQKVGRQQRRGGWGTGYKTLGSQQRSLWRMVVVDRTFWGGSKARSVPHCRAAEPPGAAWPTWAGAGREAGTSRNDRRGSPDSRAWWRSGCPGHGSTVGGSNVNGAARKRKGQELGRWGEVTDGWRAAMRKDTER